MVSFTEQKYGGTDRAAQRSCGCPIPGGVQGQVGWALGSLIRWGATSPWQEVGTE